MSKMFSLPRLPLIVLAAVVSIQASRAQAAQVPVAAASAAPIVAVPTSASAAKQIQVADEIIRRLRRLGINFNRSRLTRPYDPEGYLC